MMRPIPCTEQPAPSRLVAIDALKGISILGVVCIHSGFQSRYNGAALDFVVMLKTLFAWSVLAFFFAAGFVRYSRERKEDLGEFARRRALQLLLPCALLSVGNRVALELLSALGLARLTETRTIFDWLLPVPPQFYFLPVLFVVSIGLEILTRVSPFCRLATISTLAFLAMLVAVFSNVLAPNGPDLSLLPFYFSAYCAGATTGLMFYHGQQFARKKTFIIGVFLACSPVLMVWNHQLGWLFVPPVLAYLCWCVRHTNISLILAWLGRRSGTIYLWHAPLLLPALSLLVVHTGLNGVLAVIITLVLSIALSLVTGTMIARYDRWHLVSF